MGAQKIVCPAMHGRGAHMRAGVSEMRSRSSRRPVWYRSAPAAHLVARGPWPATIDPPGDRLRLATARRRITSICRRVVRSARYGTGWQIMWAVRTCRKTVETTRGGRHMEGNCYRVYSRSAVEAHERITSHLRTGAGGCQTPARVAGSAVLDFIMRIRLIPISNRTARIDTMPILLPTASSRRDSRCVFRGCAS